MVENYSRVAVHFTVCHPFSVCVNEEEEASLQSPSAKSMGDASLVSVASQSLETQTDNGMWRKCFVTGPHSHTCKCG